MKRVAQFDLETGRRIAVYPTLTKAAAGVYRGDIATISRACRGIYGQAYGYGWRFVRLNAYGEYVVVPLPQRGRGADREEEGGGTLPRRGRENDRSMVTEPEKHSKERTADAEVLHGRRGDRPGVPDGKE